MFADILVMLADSFGYAGLWLGVFIAAIPGISALFLAAFTVYQVVRLLIRPLVGAASSDMVRGVRKNQGSKSRED